MFTGIVEEIGIIKSVLHGQGSSKLTISCREVLDDIGIGDSINTNGVCLTVVSLTNDAFTVDVMQETMTRTGLKTIKPGDRVNLERALRLSDRLGGHLVSGHIDGTGMISNTGKDENAMWLRVNADASILKYIVEKGSVALDGISLTVVHVDEHSFDVSIIPHTQVQTMVRSKKVGDKVNIECDMIAKYLEKLTKTGNDHSKLDLNFLAEKGYI